jgi:hypothetical protein
MSSNGESSAESPKARDWTKPEGTEDNTAQYGTQRLELPSNCVTLGKSFSILGLCALVYQMRGVMVLDDL